MVDYSTLRYFQARRLETVFLILELFFWQLEYISIYRLPASNWRLIASINFINLFVGHFFGISAAKDNSGQRLFWIKVKHAAEAASAAKKLSQLPEAWAMQRDCAPRHFFAPTAQREPSLRLDGNHPVAPGTVSRATSGQLVFMIELIRPIAILRL
jgi:hypothetical protein